MFGKFLKTHIGVLSSVITLVSVFAAQGCRLIIYQPEEPDGLVEFANKGKGGKL